MKDKKYIRLTKVKTIETAKAILEEKVGVIEGARLMQGLLWQAEDSEEDGDLLVFIGIDSETDDLPVGEERQHWSEEALKEKDIEIRRCEKLYREAAREACARIIERWKDIV
jgi:hypothetical protein